MRAEVSPQPEQKSAPAGGVWRKAVAGLIVAAAAVFVVLVFALTLTPSTIGGSDYIQYWSAGVQLAHHANPYDPQGLLQVEHQNGMKDVAPTISISPPVALECELPLGLVSAKTGFILWLLAELVSLLTSVGLLWLRFGKPASRYHLLGFVFAPVIACLMAGQLGIFFLLGFVLFLFLEREHPYLAGACLVLFALKPHLFVVFGLTLMIACIARRKLSPVVGVLLAMGASCALSVWIDPHAWGQYSKLVAQLRLNDVFIPTLGVALRFTIHRSAVWLEFLPEIGACVWAIWYFWSRRERWDWIEHGGLVLLVSVVAAPYSWVTDQALLFPAVLAAIYSIAQRKKALRGALLTFAAIDVAIIVQLTKVPSLPSPVYLWIAPAWLVWVGYVRRRGVNSNS